MAMTPSQYLKLARRDFKHLPANVCDEILEGVEKADSGCQFLAVPDYIPKKYHCHMQAAWTTMVYRILFTNASRKYSLIQRHKILQKSL
ncbi:MAG: hypothetical protein K2I81_04620 [Alphaproteobacteria bacterium]|nr:hypothetical protein [Alphaproteobacteria bacterium]